MIVSTTAGGGEAAAVRELRAQLRWWRRGRAAVTFGQVLSDAYVAVLSVLILGAMAVSALLETRAFAGSACTSVGCTEARSALPALFVLALVAGCLTLSRLFGPMLVTPAVGSWLLPAPLDRRALLRPRLLATVAGSFATTGLLAVPFAVVAGLSVPAVVGTGLVAASSGAGTVAVCVLAQPGHGRLVRVSNGVVAVLVWVGLLAVTLGMVPVRSWPPWQNAWTAAAGVGTLLTVSLAVAADRSLPRLGRAQLAPGGSLVPSLSGALAVLDLALVYDVLLGRRWLAQGRVEPARRLPRWLGTGAGALVARDLLRFRRSPRPVLVLAAALVLPYLAVTLGMGRVILLVVAATGFAAGLGLLAGLRVLARTPGLVRTFPQSPPVLYAAAAAVPGATLLLWGVAAAPSLRTGLDVGWPTALAAGVAVGAVAFAAATWWMTGAPPDYQMPLVSSPAGAVPPGLLLAAARGMDVVVLGVVPLMVFPSVVGAAVSGLIALGVLWWQADHVHPKRT